MSDEKSPAKAAAPIGPKAEAPVKPKKVQLRAVHGLIIHPGTETRFVTDAAKGHVVDAWVKMQMEAGKLVEASDDDDA